MVETRGGDGDGDVTSGCGGLAGLDVGACVGKMLSNMKYAAYVQWV